MQGGGHKILDTHLGSGSSRIAAFYMGLDFYGCELNKEYYDKSVERFNRECQGTETIAGLKIEQKSLF